MTKRSSAKNFKDIRDYPKYWAESLLPAPFLPMTKEEMDLLGWDSCDVILVTGDAYIDHPSFCTAIVGRYLELMGFRVGVISQPDWKSTKDFEKLGRPNLFFGVNAGNMDSMINHYTADKKIRTDDAYTPGGVAGKRPDRAVTVYTQRLKQAFKEVPVIIGGIEASLRRLAHYDYWSDTVKNSVLADSKADILVYGNGERPLSEIAYRLSLGENIKSIKDVRGTAVMTSDALDSYCGIDYRNISHQAFIEPNAFANPYNVNCKKSNSDYTSSEQKEFTNFDKYSSLKNNKNLSIDFKLDTTSSESDICLDSQINNNSNLDYNEKSNKNYIEERINYNIKIKPQIKTNELEFLLLPSAEKVKKDKLLYSHFASILLKETNPYCARALMQKHGERYVWVNPPAFPLTEEEMDYVYSIKYQRLPHPIYNGQEIPALEMIKTSVSIMRGCFGGCSFCSIVAHEGKFIQSRSTENILEELHEIKDKAIGFTGVISDLGGPSANMYKLGCTNEKTRNVCRKVSCLYPEPCQFLKTDHSQLIDLYRKARDLPFIKKILVASGVRIDLALLDKRYIKELVMHHTGGYLKIAPEHTEPEVLSKMLKPQTDIYYKFKELFDSYSSTANKQQYLIPYFMASHPGSTILSMINLALWLKKNNFRVDQVQNFYPTPMAGATTMYHTGINPYEKITDSTTENVFVVKGEIQRRIQKIILRYHDSNNFKVIRNVLRELKLDYLIGNQKDALVPPDSKSKYITPVKVIDNKNESAYKRSNHLTNNQNKTKNNHKNKSSHVKNNKKK